MVDLQRKMAEGKDVIMEGRDIGTYVFPNADVKIFLTASIAERARRRWLELSKKGYDIDLAQIQQEIAARDKMDMEREIAPLQQAPDAILLDTTALSIEEAVAEIIKLCQ